MSNASGDNEQRLREVQMIKADTLPEEYAAVVDSLTPDELEAIVAVKKRLDEAERVSGSSVGDVFIAP
jgi:hypothetical protein